MMSTERYRGLNLRQVGTWVVLASALLLVAAYSLRDDDATATGQEIPEPRSGRTAVFVTDFGLGLSGGWRDGPSDVDDSMAVALAAASPELDVVGLVTAFGNTTMSPQAGVAAPGFLEVLEYGEVAVVNGAYRPISNPQVTFGGEDVNGACLTEGVEFLAEVLRQRDDVIVFGIAPLSPVACLVLNFPELADQIGDLVVLMGIEPGTSLEINSHELSDFNFGVDVRAAQVVFEQSEIPITLITFEISSASLVTVDQINQIGDLDNPLSQYFFEHSRDWVNFWTSDIEEDGIHPWDANTVWWALNPEAYSCTMTGFEIEVPSDFKPGEAIDNTGPRLLVGDQYDSRQVRACTSYASDETEAEFIDAVIEALSS